MRIRLLLSATLLTLFSAFACAQDDSARYAMYWVQFTNKYQSPYSVERPEEFLSAAAIERRQRTGIPVTQEDLPVNPEYVKRVQALDPNLRVRNRSRWLNGITVYSDKPGIREEIQALPCVLLCERTAILKRPEPDSIAYEYMPFPPKFGHIYPDAGYGRADTQLRLNNAQWLHRMGYRGEGIRMAVLDGGFQNADSIRHLRHLRESGRVKAVRNFAQPYADPFRDGRHGTYVLSCIASYLPGELVGSAPEADIYLAQTEDNRFEAMVEEDNWIAGMEWADSLGCDMVSASLSYFIFDDSTTSHTYAQTDGRSARVSKVAAIAASKGILLCTSAGNQGAGKWKFVGFPSDGLHVFTVGAVAPNGRSAPFSSKGPTADGRVKPDGCAVGWGTWVGAPWGKTIQSSGTSFSTPLMAGMIACLRQAFPDAGVDELIGVLHRSGSRYGSTLGGGTPDSTLGYGVTDMMEAYNLLNNRKADTSIITMLCPTNTAGYDRQELHFNVSVKQACQVAFRFTWQDGTAQPPHPESLIVKKLKPGGVYRLSVELPAADTTAPWKLLTVTGQVLSKQADDNGGSGTPAFTWRIGFEKEAQRLSEDFGLPHPWPKKWHLRLKLKR